MTENEKKEKFNTDEFFIEKIQYSEIDEVANILTDAFKTNPAYSIIFRKKEHLEDGLLWLFKTNLFMINQKQFFTNVVKKKEYRQNNRKYKINEINEIAKIME